MNWLAPPPECSATTRIHDGIVSAGTYALEMNASGITKNPDGLRGLRVAGEHPEAQEQPTDRAPEDDAQPEGRERVQDAPLQPEAHHEAGGHAERFAFGLDVLVRGLETYATG